MEQIADMNSTPKTVADFLRAYPSATLNMMTPGGYATVTPELGQQLLAGGSVPAHPGCPGRELARQVDAGERLPQDIIDLYANANDPNRFHALTDYPMEHSTPEQDEQGPFQCQQM